MKNIIIYTNDKEVNRVVNPVNLIDAIEQTFNIRSNFNLIVSRLSHETRQPNGVYTFWIGGRLYTAIWLEKVRQVRNKQSVFFNIAKTI